MRTILTCGQKAKQTHITRFVLICSRNFTITLDFVLALILLKKLLPNSNFLQTCQRYMSTN
jgi:hypothetical protein